uniref:Uncharacterized protein n=1 Tax=Tanacetum cinerariifolium TaxID=118510 RepID=A0A699QWR8_TANCI|nr:hypothetical protein [Tanacetum cinerariifolium]
MLPARKRVWALPSGHLASRSPVTSVPLATPTPGALSLADIDANTAAAETAAALEVGIGIEVDVGVEVWLSLTQSLGGRHFKYVVRTRYGHYEF